MNKEELIQELKNLKGGQWTEKFADAIAAVLDEYIDNQGPLSYNNVSGYHIDSISEEPVSEDLEEAAFNYSFGRFTEEKMAVQRRCARIGFRAGAEWRKEQMLEKACAWWLDEFTYPNITDEEKEMYQAKVLEFKKAMEKD